VYDVEDGRVTRARGVPAEVGEVTERS